MRDPAQTTLHIFTYLVPINCIIIVGGNCCLFPHVPCYIELLLGGNCCFSSCLCLLPGNLPKETTAMDVIGFFNLPKNQSQQTVCVDITMDLRSRTCTGSGHITVPWAMVNTASKRDGRQVLNF